jgi:hypothetical protein
LTGALTQPLCFAERSATSDSGIDAFSDHRFLSPTGKRATGKYNSSMVTMSYLDRLLEPLTGEFTPKMALALLELRADSELEAHIGELRRKANYGTLTPAEDAEYKDFVENVDLISGMQTRARRFLSQQSA